ncbi:hypothetical protein [Bradyrhizobium sp. USDA 313]|uniref:hypothetical protein n=1 Tax=Bradyrhizobium sp. USDA 313 TaxID=3156307 RepID=UPI0035181A17
MTIPLYPSEAEIAVLVLGAKRAREWPAKARYLEDKHGLPRIDEVMGGRFWPAVVEYFRRRHGVSLDAPDRIHTVPHGHGAPIIIGRRRRPE